MFLKIHIQQLQAALSAFQEPSTVANHLPAPGLFHAQLITLLLISLKSRTRRGLPHNPGLHCAHQRLLGVFPLHRHLQIIQPRSEHGHSTLPLARKHASGAISDSSSPLHTWQWLHPQVLSTVLPNSSRLWPPPTTAHLGPNLYAGQEATVIPPPGEDTRPAPPVHWRRKWQPTPVFLPGESQGQGGLVGYHLWDRTESDTTEVT